MNKEKQLRAILSENIYNSTCSNGIAIVDTVNNIINTPLVQGMLDDWISDSKKLKEGVDYVFHMHGQSLLMFGRYQKINDTLHYRFGTANGSEDGSMLLNALPVTLPTPPE